MPSAIPLYISTIALHGLAFAAAGTSIALVSRRARKSGSPHNELLPIDSPLRYMALRSRLLLMCGIGMALDSVNNIYHYHTFFTATQGSSYSFVVHRISRSFLIHPTAFFSALALVARCASTRTNVDNAKRKKIVRVARWITTIGVVLVVIASSDGCQVNQPFENPSTAKTEARHPSIHSSSSGDSNPSGARQKPTWKTPLRVFKKLSKSAAPSNAIRQHLTASLRTMAALNLSQWLCIITLTCLPPDWTVTTLSFRPAAASSFVLSITIMTECLFERIMHYQRKSGTAAGMASRPALFEGMTVVDGGEMAAGVGNVVLVCSPATCPPTCDTQYTFVH
ncbi:hypothetical protein BCR44DRAFT_1440480 [Catenaria anguillulae PL171]|uniref:Uncharacterized protein n=1 Tax=Catenaria anguillulae PL171 TaxID=765915 RepID=A0A1Y2HF16_9FUNG|nr:hypothetical protein BCR44DRAFT_1440480 [Catenaria anguillulae PL171]